MKYITDTMIEEMKRRCEAFLEARKEGKGYYVLRDTARNVIVFAGALSAMETVSIFDLNSEPKGDGAR